MSIKYLGFNVPVLLKDGTTCLSQHLKTYDILSPDITINNIEIINLLLLQLQLRHRPQLLLLLELPQVHLLQ
jgi:hypothetical protein